MFLSLPVDFCEPPQLIGSIRKNDGINFGWFIVEVMGYEVDAGSQRLRSEGRTVEMVRFLGYGVKDF